MVQYCWGRDSRNVEGHRDNFADIPQLIRFQVKLFDVLEDNINTRICIPPSTNTATREGVRRGTQGLKEPHIVRSCFRHASASKCDNSDHQ